MSGVGDTGDHWRVVCDADFWERDDSVVLKHVDTGAFLASSGKKLCLIPYNLILMGIFLGHAYGRPINGQLEIVGLSRQDSSCQWQTAEGLYVHRSNFNPKANQVNKPDHSEL